MPSPGNDFINRIDLLGLKVPIYRVSETGRVFTTNSSFSRSVISGIRQVGGDAGVLGVERIADSEGEFLAWKLVIRSGNPASACSTCWAQLKAAINADFEIRIRYDHYALDSARGATTGDVRNVDINHEKLVRLPEVAPGYTYAFRKRWEYDDKKVPFGILLWHEAIAHATLGHDHPAELWNRFGAKTPEVDPTIAVENIARECLRTNGFNIGDRYPKYYGVP